MARPDVSAGADQKLPPPMVDAILDANFLKAFTRLSDRLPESAKAAAAQAAKAAPAAPAAAARAGSGSAQTDDDDGPMKPLHTSKGTAPNGELKGTAGRVPALQTICVSFTLLKGAGVSVQPQGNAGNLGCTQICLSGSMAEGGCRLSGLHVNACLTAWLRSARLPERQNAGHSVCCCCKPPCSSIQPSVAATVAANTLQLLQDIVTSLALASRAFRLLHLCRRGKPP